MSTILPVVLSGGVGSRLWPLSRELFPKQLLPLLNGKSLLQNTFQRLLSVPHILSPLVTCNEQHRFIVAEQLGELQVVPSTILLEPFGRNTAPAITLAALRAIEEGGDPILLILPVDHVINHENAFVSAVATALPLADAGQLVTFGVIPTKPDTAYGYIKAGQIVLGEQIYQVERFVEKPDLQSAMTYFSEGGYYWNSGIFMFRASAILDKLKQHALDILQTCQTAMKHSVASKNFLHIDAQAFEQCPSDSIDYAVMEKTSNLFVIPAQLGWSDLGSWASLWEWRQQDGNNNFLEGDVHVENVLDSYLHANHRMLAVIGMRDCIVMETADAVLVAHKDQAQEVKKIVDRLKLAGRTETILHRRVYRPWGSYELIDESSNFKVKRITVNPGQALSLQLHHHRAEHWVVVQGIAKVRRGDEVFTLSENQSTYIPAETLHRLSNPDKRLLEIIEIQSGDYLEEDDIVRLEDAYGREG